MVVGRAGRCHRHRPLEDRLRLGPLAARLVRPGPQQQQAGRVVSPPGRDLDPASRELADGRAYARILSYAREGGIRLRDEEAVEPEGGGALQRGGGLRRVARCGGWVRLTEPMRPDAALIAAYTDGWPHALFSRIGPEAGIAAVPTVDLTIHFRERMPLPGAREDDYCLTVFRTDVAADGFVEEDAQVWSREGVLLAQSRSLGRIVLTG